MMKFRTAHRFATILLALASASASARADALFPSLPLPPAVEGLFGLSPGLPTGRSLYLSLIRSKAEKFGIPADLADAVAFVESSYNPNAVGGVGEVGLMQIRPETASMLGYRGSSAGLFEPQTNVEFSVTYLAGAWQRANGDLCRTLMKYRAGHGEERMTPLSADYCRRARSYLATLGSPLGKGADPIVLAAAKPKVWTARPPRPLPARAGRTPSAREVAAAARIRSAELTRKLRSAQSWAAHEARIRTITAKLKNSRLNVAVGI